MGSTQPRRSTRAGNARPTKSVRKTTRKQARTEDLEHHRAAASLRRLGLRGHNSRATELPHINSTHAVREMPGGAPTTALDQVHDQLEIAWSVAIVCAIALKAQAADHDREMAQTLQRCVADVIADQMQRINTLLKGGES